MGVLDSLLRLSPQSQAFVLLAAVEVPAVMANFEPSPFTMATFARNPEKITWIRRGYVVGGGLSIIFSFALARFAGSSWPLIVTAGVLAISIVFYEWAIRHGRRHGQDMRAGAS